MTGSAGSSGPGSADRPGGSPHDVVLGRLLDGVPDGPVHGPPGRPRMPVPWFAHPVPPDRAYLALRPVPEDEVEEPDEDGPWNLHRTRPAPVGVRSPAPREAASLVAWVLGRALKAHRWSIRLSQAAYGRRTGRAQGTVSRLERGASPLTVLDLVDLALETGRAVAVQVLVDECATAGWGHVHEVRLGPGGSLRVMLGEAPRVPPPAPR